MLKITVRYQDEAELQRYLCTIYHHIVKCKPPLSKPGTKGVDGKYFRRDIWLETTTNSDKAVAKSQHDVL